MRDTPQDLFTRPDDRTAELRPGDIVSFRFPANEEDATAPQLRPRPCLVLERRTRGGEVYAVLAYGTHRSVKSSTDGDLRVGSAVALAEAGLDSPVRFLLWKHVLVPLMHRRFACDPRTGSPVLGRLTGKPRDAFEANRAKYRALRDIAATRCKETRRERSEQRRDDRARAAATASTSGRIA